MQVNNASPAIIGQTRPEHFDYARLYFRPRTPTYFCNEGIRPLGARDREAHCPMPVYFCFDALTVLAQDTTEFSNGGIGSSMASKGAERTFFLSIPFNYVFHEGSYKPEDRDQMVFHRQAEVLVPTGLALENALKYIVCRSAAEGQTLLQLIAPKFRKQFMSILKINRTFFYCRWTFVEEVIAENDQLILRFNPNTQTPGPFNARLIFEAQGSKLPREWSGQLQGLENFRVRPEKGSMGILTLFLDDSLAFSGEVAVKKTVF